jgi:hypothetical protein
VLGQLPADRGEVLGQLPADRGEALGQLPADRGEVLGQLPADRGEVLGQLPADRFERLYIVVMTRAAGSRLALLAFLARKARKALTTLPPVVGFSCHRQGGDHNELHGHAKNQNNHPGRAGQTNPQHRSIARDDCR